MQLGTEDIHCPKCDEHRYAKNRTKTLVVDIAHNRQRLEQAEFQLDKAIDQAIAENFGALKVIVGGGIIRQEIPKSLDAALWQKRIGDYQPEDKNAGAYIIQLKPSKKLAN